MKKSAIVLALALAVGAAISYASGTGSTETGPPKTVVHEIGWFDNLSDAQRVAKAQGKPILYFSIFGELDEELPCANARTLRATLFKDPSFKELISKDVIPAWEMVRAVPKITIDLGDGKPIKRTVRGNAVMYLCNSDGKVIDAFPGIHTAEDFMPMVKESIAKLGKASDAEVIAYHKATKPKLSFGELRMTMSKSVGESPTLALMGARSIRGAETKPVSGTPISAEKRLFLQGASRLRDASLTPMSVEDSVRLATRKPIEGLSSEEVANAVLKADSNLNVTSVRNVIHLWFASETKLPTPLEARDTVLETILKIPYKDPYFGLRDVIMPGTPW